MACERVSPLLRNTGKVTKGVMLEQWGARSYDKRVPALCMILGLDPLATALTRLDPYPANQDVRYAMIDSMGDRTRTVLGSESYR